MKENNAYLKQGKWTADRVYKILTNSIYIGIFEYGKYKRKSQDVLRVENYCEPIIDMNTWNMTRTNLEKNKHPNYGDHIHLFAGLVKCPLCGEILSASESFKKNKDGIKVYYHLRCKNTNCKGYGYHYNSDKIEEKLKRVLNELTRFMFDNSNEIITSSSTKSKEVKNIEKAINKLKMQEKRLVDLYLNSTLDVETINHKNDVIKKEINKLTKKKNTLDPDNDFKEYSVELLKKLEHEKEDNMIIFKNNLVFSFLFDSLNKKAKKELINRLVSSIEITRDKAYNIEIKDIKFTEEFISKSTKEYTDYLNELLNSNNIGIIYKEKMTKDELTKIEKDYTILSLEKVRKKSYSKKELDNYFNLMKEHFYVDGIISCPYFEGNNLVDVLVLIPKTEV